MHITNRVWLRVKATEQVREFSYVQYIFINVVLCFPGDYRETTSMKRLILTGFDQKAELPVGVESRFGPNRDA